MKYVSASAAYTFQRLGLSPKVDLPFEERLHLQKEILKDSDALYERSGVRFITDRTPIDFLAHLLADVQCENVPRSAWGEVERYMKDCFACANRHFTTVILVQPGIKLVEAPTSAPANPSYIEHLSNLMLGLMANGMLECDHYQIPRACTDLDQRVAAVSQALRKSSSRHVAKMEAMHETGLVLH